MSEPLVSVIVPIHCPAGDPATDLEACLDCLARQTCPRERFEIIVVDNGCPALEAVLGRLAAGHTPPLEVRVVREARPGSFAARNAGLRVARGEVIAFTDGDCLPYPDWVERAAESVAEGSESGIVAGSIGLVAPRPAGVSPIAYLYSATLSFPGFDHSGGFGATANLIVRRSIIDAVGLFNPTLLSGGDMDWGWRAAGLGFKTRYVSAVGVGHQARASVRSIIVRELRLAGGNQMNRELRGPPGGTSLIREILRIELKHSLRWRGASFARGRFRQCPGRARASALIVLVQALRAIERLRVLMGGAPRRS